MADFRGNKSAWGGLELYESQVELLLYQCIKISSTATQKNTKHSFL